MADAAPADGEKDEDSILVPDAPDENGLVSYSRGVIRKVQKSDKGDTLQVEIEDATGKTSGQKLVIAKGKGVPTNEKKTIEDCNDLCELPVFSNEALVDALRCNFMANNIYAYFRNTLVVVNPFKDFGKTSVKVAQDYQGGQLSPKEFAKPHIFNLCAKVQQMLATTGSNACIVLRGDSGSGKTETSKHIVRFFTSSAPEAPETNVKAVRVFAALSSAGPILQAFGSAKTIDNENSSRFGLYYQMYMGGAEVVAGRLSHFLLETSRVANRGLYSTFNFSVFYDMLHGLRRDQIEELKLKKAKDYPCLTGDAGSFGSGGHGNQGKASFHEELQPALENIGIHYKMQMDLWKCLGGILTCSCIEWRETSLGYAVCSNQEQLKEAARLLGVVEEDFHMSLSQNDRQARGVKSKSPVSVLKAVDRTMNFASTLYGEIFNWLTRRMNNLLDAPAADSRQDLRWVGILDIFGFENFIVKGHVNSLEQLLINLAEEQLNDWFMTKLADTESEAMQAQAFAGIAESQASEIISGAEESASQSRSIMELITGSSKVEGIFGILETSCLEDDDGKADKAFLDSCAQKLSRSYENTLKVDKKKAAFTISHLNGSAPVEYMTSGFTQKSKAGLEDSAIALLASSSNTVLSDVFNTISSDQEAAIARNRRFTEQLSDVLEQLRSSDSMETYSVACVRANKKANPGYFDWLSVTEDLKRIGVFDVANLQRSAARFPYRQRHADFLQEFSALCVSTPAKPRKNASEAVNVILKEGPTLEKDYAVTGQMVMLTEKAVDVLRDKQKGVQSQLQSLASEIQKAVRSSKTVTDATTARSQIVKLQACARRRRELEPMLTDRAMRRKVSVITVQSHLRTLCQKNVFREKLQEKHKEQFLKLVAGVCKMVQFLKSCRESMMANSASDDVIGPLMTLSLRCKQMRAITAASTTKLQNIRRGKVARDMVNDTKNEIASQDLLTGALEAVRLRTQLGRIVTEQKVIFLQSQRRVVQGKRQVDDVRTQKSEFEALVAAFQTVTERWQFERQRTFNATKALQANRRAVKDTRKVDVIRGDKDAFAVFASAAMTVLYRQAVVTRGTSDVAAKLQAKRRGIVDRRRVGKLRTDQDIWSALKGLSSSFLWRMIHVNYMTDRAARILQNFWRVQLSRRKVNLLKFVRLQEKLAGIWQRNQAQKLLLRLKDENVLQENVWLLSSAIETVLLRRRHHDSRENHAGLTISRTVRGMMGRRHTTHRRIIWAQRQFKGIYAVFEARKLLSTALVSQEYRYAKDIVVSHVQTLRARGRFHMFKRVLQATSTIQRYARGQLARKYYRKVGWQNRASRAQLTISCIWNRFRAQGQLLEAHWEDQIDRSQTVLLSVFRTLVARRDHEAYYQSLRLNSSACMIQQFWRGWWWRQHPDVAKVLSSIEMVRRELEDAAMNKRHAAAAEIQGAWRSWLTRQVRLLPVLISTLTAQRKSVLQARVKETGGLKGFRTTSASEAGVASQWMAEYGGAQVVNLSLPIEDTTCFSGWVDVLLALEHRGEVILDMSVGVEHAIVVCVSGRIFVYNDPGTFHDYDADFREEEFQLAPVMFREPLRVEPNIIAVACGDRHALALSDQGVVWAWGWNERGQCGVGRHLPLECYLKMTCLQQWARKPNPASVQVKTSGGDLPRCTAIACGARHSGVVDAEGAMWMWGEHQGVGLYRVRSMNLGQSPAILLFKFSRSGKDQIKPIEDPNQKPQLTQFQQYLEEQIAQFGTGMSDGQMMDESLQDSFGPVEQQLEEHFQTTSKVLLLNTSDNRIGSLRRMLTDAQKYACIREASGDMLAPARCCNLVMCHNTEAARLRAAGTPVIDSFVSGWCCPVFAAPARGVRFVSISFGGETNCALTEKGYLYTWGKSTKGMLGRKVDVPGKPAFPVRVPLFPQLAISIISVSVGVEHVVALTSHGRVFIWGRVEACMGEEGFCRNTLQEPMFVEGVLRELRIVKVAAGRLETAVTTENFDVLLGFEMLEKSQVGHRLLPVCYQYTMTGPKTGYNDAIFSRLRIIKSQALQLLYVGGATSDYQTHLDPTPDPEGPKVRTGHNFMRKGMGHKQLINPHAANGNNRRGRQGLASQELFQWSKRHLLERATTQTDPDIKIANSQSVTKSHGNRQRDYLESDKGLVAYRRLAMSRKDSNILGLPEEIWKINGYEIEDPQYLDSEVDELEGGDEAINDDD